MNLKKLLLLLLTSSLLFVKCDNPSEPIDNEDIVPQIDIPWPSLGNTPWPMHHHDPQSTGRSKYSGPQTGVIAKKVYVGMSYSGISIGYNSSAFIGTFYPYDFYSLDYEGNIKWKYSSLFCYTTPLISSDSIIYAAGNQSFFAFTHSGDTLWKKNLSTLDKIVSVGINIDKNGNIYYIDYNNTLTVLDKNGNIKWKLRDERFLNWTDAAPTFSPDGNTLYVQGISVSVIAVDINNKTVKWIFGDKRLLSSPVIDNAGNIYIIPGEQWFSNQRSIYSLNQQGVVNWKYDFIAETLWDNTEPTIDFDGNVYFGTDTLYSITNGGKLRWKKSLNGTEIVSPLICDKDNVIYLGVQDPDNGDNKIIAVKGNGEIKWEIIDTIERELGVSPALTEEGTLFYPTWNNEIGNFFIIK